MALVTVQRSPNSVAESPQCSSDGEAEDDEGSKNEKSECFFAGKGTALVLAFKDIPQHPERRLSTDSTRSTNSTQSNSSDIQQHLQSMFNLLPHEETLKMAVKLESQRPNRTRYLVIASRCCFRAPNTTERKSKITRNNSARTAAAATASTVGAAAAVAARQLSVDSNSNSRSQQTVQSQAEASTESSNEMHERRLSSLSTSSANQQPRARGKSETMEKSASGDSNKCAAAALSAAEQEQQDEEGIEESCLLGIDCNERTTIGLVVPILADTTIHLDGDGGFSVSVFSKTHIFKPVSVQAMWSALQTLHKVSQKARENNFYPGGPSHDWLSNYASRIESEQSCLNEWNAMDSLESRRPPSPDAIRNKPTAKEETESVIKMKLKEIMMSVDLDEVTSKYIRGRLEEHLDMDLGEYKSFIDEEMLIILGQMDAPTEIFEHVYLGSEWNASNLEELQKNGVRHILNVTREIDNFFPGMFDYFNVRVYDDEKTNLLKHWDNTFRYITRAKAEGSKVLVHCKMGVSRSASVVIAYAMKAYNWEFEQALQHVKERRNCIKPNKNFLAQLETYRGMLDAMLNKEKLQRSKSETNLKSTKDARLLPGSEPTPLIQALNQSKSKSAGHGVESGGDGVESVVMSVAVSSIVSGGCEQKQRRVMRRSSSTSPKSMHGHTTATTTTAAVVMKQQSQSLENLTPERSIAADEPKNVRFPGSNGENYSVTQNQVLHIQPPPPPPPPPTSVRNIVHDLEAHKDTRKTADDRKTLNLQFSRTGSQDPATGLGEATDEAPPFSVKSLGSPVWTSSAKLITQTSHLTDSAEATVAALRHSLRRSRCDTLGSSVSSSDAGDMFSSQLDNVFAREEEKRHSRKTHSWAATSGGIVMDARPTAGGSFKLGSNSSIDSAASSNAASSTTFEGQVRTRPRQRELPSRHASWGSGDNRCGVPMRNSSWGSYDTNRNTFLQYGSAAASAIFEGQIHELNMSNKTASHAHSHSTADEGSQPQHLGTVKRTKQKLEERTALKKLCQENGARVGTSTAEEEAQHMRASTHSLQCATSPQKRNSSNLYRSASAAGSMRARYPNRCNSEEIVPSAMPGGGVAAGSNLPRIALRRSDGSRPLQSDLFSASAPESYTMSDIENKNTLPQQDAATEDCEEAAGGVTMRTTQSNTATSAAEDQRISGNVQILKKSFEAKAGAGTTLAATASGQPTAVVAAAGAAAAAGNTRKGHQSLPSSPVAQHVDHHAEHAAATGAAIATNATTTTTAAATVAAAGTSTTTTAAMAASSSSSSSSSSSVSEPYDRIAVKGLVHRYHHHSTGNSSTAVAGVGNTSPPVAASSSTTNANYRQRPRSYYENPSAQKSLSGKLHDYSDSRPPPAPAKTVSAAHPHTHAHRHTHASTATPMTESILAQPPQRRQMQELSKSHPLTRLKMSHQTFNATAYNTILFRMLRSVTYTFNFNQSNQNNNNKTDNDNNNHT